MSNQNLYRHGRRCQIANETECAFKLDQVLTERGPEWLRRCKLAFPDHGMLCYEWQNVTQIMMILGNATHCHDLTIFLNCIRTYTPCTFATRIRSQLYRPSCFNCSDGVDVAAAVWLLIEASKVM